MEPALSQVRDVMMRLPALQEAESFLQWRGRRFTAEMLLEADAQTFRLSFQAGRLVALEEGAGLLRSWDFALRADAEAWLQHWRTTPPPGFHDFFAMAKFGRLRMEGDLHPLMANLQFVKDVVALPRTAGQGAV